MAEKKNKSGATLKIYGVDTVTGKKTAIGKIKLNTMSLEEAGSFLSSKLNEADKDGATSVRGTLTVYKADN